VGNREFKALVRGSAHKEPETGEKGLHYFLMDPRRRRRSRTARIGEKGNLSQIPIGKFLSRVFYGRAKSTFLM